MGLWSGTKRCFIINVVDWVNCQGIWRTLARISCLVPRGQKIPNRENGIKELPSLTNCCEIARGFFELAETIWTLEQTVRFHSCACGCPDHEPNASGDDVSGEEGSEEEISEEKEPGDGKSGEANDC